jgi:hypothetical protein
MSLVLPKPIVIETVDGDMHVTRQNDVGKLVTYVIRNGLVAHTIECNKAIAVPLVYVPMGTTYVRRPDGSCFYQPPRATAPSVPLAEPEQLAQLEEHKTADAARELAARKLAMLVKVMRERTAQATTSKV